MLKNKRYPWTMYPIGTNVHATSGGFWEKIETGWKWCTGSVFPTPGADYSTIDIPTYPRLLTFRKVKPHILYKVVHSVEEEFEFSNQGFILSRHNGAKELWEFLLKGQ